MRRRTFNLLLAVLLLGGLAACDEGSSVLGPEDEQQAELDLVVDPDLTDAMITDAEAALDAVSASAAPSAPGLRGTPPDPALVDEARELLRQAREKFAAAREAWLAGDTELAAQLAEEGRLLVAEALVLVFGEEAYDRLLERVEHLIAWLETQTDEANSELLSRIRALKEEAESFRESDLIRATERLLLAVQIGSRERVHHRRREMRQHARLSVFMAGSAVGLATEIARAGAEPTPEQAHTLRHAQHLFEDAQRALSSGRYRLAFALAREAVNLSLVAVMLEPGIEQDRLQAMIQLSERAIQAAEEALGSGRGHDFAARLLEHAKQLRVRALEVANTSPRRAIYMLWHVSVTAYGVVQMVS